MAKDAKKQQQASSDKAAAQDADERSAPPPRPGAPKKRAPAPPSVLGSAIVNIAVHSVLMLVVPLGIYFATTHGLLDREFWERAPGPCAPVCARRRSNRVFLPPRRRRRH